MAFEEVELQPLLELVDLASTRVIKNGESAPWTDAARLR